MAMCARLLDVRELDGWPVAGGEHQVDGFEHLLLLVTRPRRYRLVVDADHL
jgi:hypothetical protein